MEVRENTLQQIGSDAGRKIAYLGESGPKPKRRKPKAAAITHPVRTRHPRPRVAKRRSARLRKVS